MPTAPSASLQHPPSDVTYLEARGHERVADTARFSSCSHSVPTGWENHKARLWIFVSPFLSCGTTSLVHSHSLHVRVQFGEDSLQLPPGWLLWHSNSIQHHRNVLRFHQKTSRTHTVSLKRIIYRFFCFNTSAAQPSHYVEMWRGHEIWTPSKISDWNSDVCM